jgi:hypothetical protein
MSSSNLTKIAVQATLHCLTGCAIGEVVGMVLSTAFGWSNLLNVITSVLLAFVFGYGLSMRPLRHHGLSFKAAFRIALSADTASIATMELSDTGFILLIPGAISAGLSTVLFWVSLVVSLIIAFVVAFPLNRYLISKGKGHAVAHQYHHHSD